MCLHLLRALLVYHKAALVAARGFWRLLMREQVPLEGLSGAFQKIDTMERLADKTYKLVLDRWAGRRVGVGGVLGDVPAPA